MTDEYPPQWKLVRSPDPRIVAANGTVVTLVRRMELGARIVRAVNAEAKLPKTADGVPIFVGDDIWRINTRDGGKTWYVTKHKVKGIEDCHGDPCCKVTPDDSKFPNGWYSTKGHNRFFNKEDAALKEAAALASKGKA